MCLIQSSLGWMMIFGILGSTLALLGVVFYPFSLSRSKVVCAKFLENRTLFKDFTVVYFDCFRTREYPLWILFFGLPFIAMMVLLDDYDYA